MFEIWQHLRSGRRYLVIVRDDEVWVAAGPLERDADPRHVLEARSDQPPNPRALLHMRRRPESYRREYTTGADRQAVRVPAPRGLRRDLS